MTKNEQNIIQFENISKYFGGVRALHEVSFGIPRGEIHALVGENGAGKSTLIRICGGVFPPDGGTIYFDGQETSFSAVEESMQTGISIVHQEIPICPHLTAAENIFLGRNLPRRRGLIDWKEVNRRTRALFDELHVDIEPTALASRLSVAEQQTVVIAQALSQESRLLIMDEPTSALNKEETERLFTILRGLRRQGITIIYVSHRMEEVFELADRVTVLRDGEYVGTRPVQEVAPDDVVQMMVGRQVDDFFPKVFHEPDPSALLSVRTLSVPGIFDDISFDLHGGEVLGLVGLQGSGASDVLQALYGQHDNLSGTIMIRGKEMHFKSSLDALKHGIAYVPSDRQNDGLFEHMNVRDNGGLLMLRRLARTLGWISLGRLGQRVNGLVDEYNIITSSIQANINSLSGGNQQKVVIARALSTEPLIVLLNDPTRGIDVGAKAEVHHILNELTGQGCGVIFVSSEMPEVLEMSDRLLVMYRGKTRAQLAHDEADHERVMRLATGADVAETGAANDTVTS
ncbi:MAG TPA: sugar ABC transporter ATP-binding protein [Candidatus Sulfomarinibacteraceae bacterium]|nr:sugar ABC transporter ATP-binding protein [Candidatus Sulfomarinibacteraceae bacterium]